MVSIYFAAFFLHYVNLGHEHRLRNGGDFQSPSAEVQRDADSLKENEIPSSASTIMAAQPQCVPLLLLTTTTMSIALTTTATLFTKTLMSIIPWWWNHFTSSASLTANLILNILLVHSYRTII